MVKALNIAGMIERERMMARNAASKMSDSKLNKIRVAIPAIQSMIQTDTLLTIEDIIAITRNEMNVRNMRPDATDDGIINMD